MIKPIDDRIAVRRTHEKLSGLIVVPDYLQENSHTGTIVAVGPGRRNAKTGKRKPLDVKVGDLVVFGRFTDWESPDGRLCLVQEADIVYVIEP